MTLGTDEQLLGELERETFDYFLHQVSPHTGLIADRTQPQAPASIAVVGMGLSALLVGVERGFVDRAEACERTLRVLRFLWRSEQSTAPDATGYRGFYFHFLEMHQGRRAYDCELSTIDTALLMAGILTAAVYFDGPNAGETELRSLADRLYRRVDWQWALDGGTTLRHGWTPEGGFLEYRWDLGYSEALLLYVLALGSPTFPIEALGYREWTATFEWKQVYGLEYFYAGPLFIHQFPQLWLDLKGIRDEANRERDLDYFENSARATLVQQRYAIDNPLHFSHYGANSWGLTASDGPGPASLVIDGVERCFDGYLARGAPFGPDDGTVAPWAVVASLPFAPAIVLSSIRHAIEGLKQRRHRLFGFDASFNPTFPAADGNPFGWVSPWRFGLNQAPMVLMIENFRSRLVWNLSRRCGPMVNGLRRAGFTGGWLAQAQHS